MDRNPSQQKTKLKRIWIDITWMVVSLFLLISIFQELQTGRLCHQMGVDFRGYYASAQIALQYGFSEVYNQELQMDFQSPLLYRCSPPPDQPPLYVAMPYLPPFVIFFLPLTFLDFTTSYFIWVSLHLALFLFYLHRFSKALGARVNFYRILQWGISIPLIANLNLGQINVFLVILFGEFVLTLSRGKKLSSGFWLSTLLMKPHTVILLLPALMLSQSWQVLMGFTVGSAVVISISLLLVGFQGLASIGFLAYQFAGSLIQTAPGMMNWRALALNLEQVIPAWFAWLIFAVGTVVVFLLVMRRWSHWQHTSITQLVLLIVATGIGTFVVSWHSHFYMLILLVPLLVFLDTKHILPPNWLTAWLIGPPVIYLVAHLLNPEIERNLFGLGMLALNIFTLYVILKLLPLPILVEEPFKNTC
jgi:hypothetical protein